VDNRKDDIADPGILPDGVKRQLHHFPQEIQRGERGQIRERNESPGQPVAIPVLGAYAIF
jgi:hypothetical protein